MTATPARRDRTAHNGRHYARRATFTPLVDAGLINCWRCQQPITPGTEWDLGHRIDRALGGTDEDTYPEHRWPTGDCPGNRKAGGWRTANAKRKAERGTPTPPPPTRGNPRRSDDDNAADPAFFGDATSPVGSAKETSLPPDFPEIGPDAADSSWDRCDWLESLRDVPAEAAWPRLMTGPHPRAAGSYGPGAVEWLESEAGITLRWFQRLALARALEHDADGALVWLELLLSTARQVGKSVGVRAGATWRMHQAGLFGEPQLVLHTARDMAVARDVQAPIRAWARRHPGYLVREVNGAQEVATPGAEDERSRWLIRAVTAAYGYPSTLGIVDEAWDIAADVVDDGIEPTQSERVQPQLWLLSTAHRRATTLFPSRRAAALRRLRDPSSTLLIEWSAPAEVDIEDRAAWRLASPHWSPLRERVLEAKLERVQSGGSVDPAEPDPVESFRAQYLDVWPTRAASSGSDESFDDAGAWRRLGDRSAPVPAGQLVIALADWSGREAVGAGAGRDAAGRVFVFGRVFRSRGAAALWAGRLLETHLGSRLLAGASLVKDPTVAGLGAEPFTGAQTRAAVPALRAAVRAGRVRHDGGAELAGQVAGWRVAQRESGLATSTRSGRADLATSAAVAAAELEQTPPVPEFFVY